jgi:hypothetical protein
MAQERIFFQGILESLKNRLAVSGRGPAGAKAQFYRIVFGTTEVVP